MKLLIVSQYFWPEEFRVNDLAADLVLRGHEVTVLTGNPNYPQGKFYKNYGFRFSREEKFGVKILRVPLFARGNASGFRLALNYLSFALNGCLRVPFIGKEFDACIVFAISPITAVYPALLHKFMYGTKVNLWVQDLWPESVSSAGKLNTSFTTRILTSVVKHIYRSSSKILVQSEAFIPSLLEKGVPTQKIRYVPNWAEDLFLDDSVIQPTKFAEIMPSGFKVMFAGNIGEAQDFDSVVQAADLTRDFPDIKWIIVGDGRKRPWVESEIERLGLKETVFLLGRYPLEDMPSFFSHADIMLLSLKEDEIFSLTIPSKIQSYMAFGKPIAGMLNGIGAKVIRDSECGYTADAGDFNALANNVIQAYQQESNVLASMGQKGKNYYHDNFSKKVMIDHLLEIFQER